MRISEEDTGFSIGLLKVLAPRVVEDNSNYEVTAGNERTLVLACRGEGTWDTGDTFDVRLALSVDSDGESWIFYKALM